MGTASSSTLSPGVRVPMSWEEYLRTPESRQIEYIDGAAVMSPPPTVRQGIAVVRIQAAVQPLLPEGYLALSGVAWKPAESEYAPDVIVVPTDAPEDRFLGIPPMVCEVVPSNRADDLVRKLQKYARVGAPQYWIVDPRDREIVGLELRGDLYEEYARVDAEHQSATFVMALGDGIPVELTYEQFFA